MARFEFVACSELIQILGLRADDERELAEILADVPLDSVHYHTHGHFLRHGFVGAPYGNDFASWAATEVRDRVLGERLAVVSPLDFATLEGLREEILTIIDDHLSHMSIVPRVIFGEPFDFMQSRLVPVSTGVTAGSLEEFRAGLAGAHPSALYFHAIESQRRLPRAGTDFAVWLREVLGRPDLAAAFDRVEIYSGSLERLRSELLRLCDAELGTLMDQPEGWRREGGTPPKGRIPESPRAPVPGESARGAPDGSGRPAASGGPSE
jgi:hypothetical protein